MFAARPAEKHVFASPLSLFHTQTNPHDNPITDPHPMFISEPVFAPIRGTDGRTLVALYSVCQNKVPTFKLSATLSNRKRFLECSHCWKAYEIS